MASGRALFFQLISPLISLPLSVVFALTAAACLAERPPPDKDGDSVLASDDCDDLNPMIGSRYFDGDGDRVGTGSPLSGCGVQGAYVGVAGDCDDTDPSIYPGALEQCNAQDDNCDGLIDELLPVVTCYPDADGDGAGDYDVSAAEAEADSCRCPQGTSVWQTDCDDGDPFIYPGAVEEDPTIDANCDGLTLGAISCCRDGDGDFTGNPFECRLENGCSPGYVPDSRDCDDTRAAVSPLAPELCDGLDNDCDLLVDEELLSSYYLDEDQDGYGIGQGGSCDALSNVTAARGGDCRDDLPFVYPLALEVVDGLDTDCDGLGESLSRVAGGGETAVAAGGGALEASFRELSAVVQTPDGTVYLADAGVHQVFALKEGLLEQVAGTGEAGAAGDGGLATLAMLNEPRGLAVDAGGRLLVADAGNHRIRRLEADGRITTIAGTGTSGCTLEAAQALETQLDRPLSVAVRPDGTVVIADSYNCLIREVKVDGSSAPLLGVGDTCLLPPLGAGIVDTFRLPVSLAVDLSSPSLEAVVDAAANRLYLLTEAGLEAFAGTGAVGEAVEGAPAIQEPLSSPLALAMGGGYAYVADSGNRRVRVVEPSGRLFTVAGTGSSASRPFCEGSPLECALGTPGSLCLTLGGDLLGVDLETDVLWRISP